MSTYSDALLDDLRGIISRIVNGQLEIEVTPPRPRDRAGWRIRFVKGSSR